MNNLSQNEELCNYIATFLRCDKDIIRLYLIILDAPKTKNEIEISIGCSFCCFDKYIAMLSSLCLISSYRDRYNCQVFFAINPQFSFPAIILAEMWNVDTNLHTINDLILRPDLKDLNNRYLECKQIINRTKDLYRKQLPFLKEMAVVIDGSRRIASCISELLETADSEILAVVSPPHLLGEIVWQTIVEKMKDGIVYQRITTFDELVRHGYEIFKNEIQNYNETIYICKDSTLSHKFYVINNVTVVFFIPDIKSKDFKFEAQIVNNAGWAERYKGVYRQIQSESFISTDLIGKIECFRKHFLEKASDFLTDEEHGWLTDVFDYGVFCKHQNYPSCTYDSAKRKCLYKAFITENSKHEIFPNYSLQEVLDYAL